MAIVLPLLAVLGLAIWQFGVVYDQWRALDTAAIDGARAAASAPAGSERAAGEAAAGNAAAGQVTLDSFTLDRTAVKGGAAYTATVCSSYHINVLGITFKRGQLCREATVPVA